MYIQRLMAILQVEVCPIDFLVTAREEGLAEGFEQGIEKGIERGTRQNSLTIAENLLDILDDATIAHKTGLTTEDVKVLRKRKR